MSEAQQFEDLAVRISHCVAAYPVLVEFVRRVYYADAESRQNEIVYAAKDLLRELGEPLE